MKTDDKQIGLFDEADRKLAERFRTEKPNPIDTAKDMKKAMDEFGLTQEEFAARIGKSRSAVANTLRLLTLSPEIIRLVSQNRLSAGHARALVTLSQREQEAVAMQVVRKHSQRARNGKTCQKQGLVCRFVEAKPRTSRPDKKIATRFRHESHIKRHGRQGQNHDRILLARRPRKILRDREQNRGLPRFLKPRKPH